MKIFLSSILILSLSVVSLMNFASAEEYFVSIPFGAYDPTFDTPVENWFDPPVVAINVDDTVTWINDDREGHTVTSGQGTGRFGWMSGTKFGQPTGVFDSGRFLKDESWSFTFSNTGLFNYYCTIHPWMEGVVFVGESIPDYPHDANGQRIDEFPIIGYTHDGIVELDLTWEPDVILTHEKVSFIYHTYDPATNSNLDKMKYDFILLQSGVEIFRDEGLTSVGGDYRNYIFDKPGPIEIRFENIESGGSSGIESAARGPAADLSMRTIVFTAMVYDNTQKQEHHEIVVQPAKRVQLQYELMILIITIPGALAIIAVLYMMYGKGKRSFRKPGAVKI